MIGLLQVSIVSALCLFLVVWLAVALTSGRLDWNKRLEHGERERLARAILYAPIWIPGLLMAAVYIPTLGTQLGWIVDHCFEVQPAHHHHFCWIHPPHQAAVNPLFLLLLPLGALGTAAYGLLRFKRSTETTRTLSGLSKTKHQAGVTFHLLEDNRPLAFTMGIWKPVIFLSRGFVSRVSKQTVAVVLAHEAAHCTRKDNLWGLCDRLCGAMLPKAVSARLLDQILLAREQACDHLAAKRIGNRQAVMKAIVELVRFSMVNVPKTAGINDASMVKRMQYLADPPKARWSLSLTIIVLALSLILAGIGPMHAFLERLVGWLIH